MSLLVFDDGELVAVFPGNRVKDTLFSHQGLTYGGLVLKVDLKLINVLKSFQSVLQYCNDAGISSIELKTTPKIYHQSPSDEMDYILFKLNAELTRCDVLSVIEPKRLVYSRDRKSGIKRGQKNRLTVKETDNFEDFWTKILIPNLALKHQADPVHTLEEITLLKAKFPNNLRQFNVYDANGMIVAGSTIFESKLVAHSQYISGNVNKNTLGSLDFLHDHLLRKVFAKKPFFDFGISNEDQGRHINEGLLYWKEGFGARSIAHSFYKIKTVNHTHLNTIYR